jgi:hypothetical protein
MAEHETVYNNGSIFVDAEILDETFTFLGAGFEVRVVLHELAWEDLNIALYVSAYRQLRTC